MALSKPPVARATMLIRCSVRTVYDAFVNPEVTTKFWFSRSTGQLVPGTTVTWFWDTYNVSGDVRVVALEQNKRICIEWPTPVEWVFEARGDSATFVSITASGFAGTEDEQVSQALDSNEGFNLVIAACKAYLEHGIQINVVADKAAQA